MCDSFKKIKMDSFITFKTLTKHYLPKSLGEFGFNHFSYLYQQKNNNEGMFFAYLFVVAKIWGWKKKYFLRMYLFWLIIETKYSH